MSKRQATELEQAISALTRAFAEKLDSLATSDFIREGVLREAIAGLVWDIFQQMPDQRTALAEALENWPDLVREATQSEQSGREV